MTRINLYNIFKTLIYMLLLLLIFISILCFFGKHNFILDNISNFRYQLSVISSITLIFAFIGYFFLKYPKNLLFLSFIAFSLNITETYKYVSFFNQDIKPFKNVKIFYANVLTSNKNYNTLLKQIYKDNPDIIFLLEVDNKWINSLKNLKITYKYGIDLPRNDNFGLMICSKKPLNNIKIHYFSYDHIYIPYITLNTIINNSQVNFILIHTTPPYDELHFNSRNQQLNHLSNIVNSEKQPIVVIGDFNATHFTYFYKNFLSKTNLINPRTSFGNTPTWPTSLNPFYHIPIDSILHSQNIQTHSFKIGNHFGSDHLPITTVISCNNSS